MRAPQIDGERLYTSAGESRRNTGGQTAGAACG
jgi:hypothetical protein